MQSKILKMSIVLCVSLVAILNSNCKGKSDLEGQITITINSIDKETKQRRINKFDTVVVRKEGIGYLTKTFDKIGEYVTDSTGSDMYYPGYLKDGQEVNIGVISLENR
jgi:hypothetical protein